MSQQSRASHSLADCTNLVLAGASYQRAQRASTGARSKLYTILLYPNTQSRPGDLCAISEQWSKAEPPRDSACWRDSREPGSCLSGSSTTLMVIYTIDICPEEV